jgi:prepilin-type N-terminal cleavage/methylation domain-containing protein
MFRSANHRNPGLTLIELLVVIAILAVLAAMVVPLLSGLTDTAKSAAAASTIADTAKAVETYHAVNSMYPDGNDLLIEPDKTTVFTKLSPGLTALIGAPTDFSGVPDPAHARLAMRKAGFNHFAVNDPSLPPNDSGSTTYHFCTSTGALHADGIKLLPIDKSAGSAGRAFLETAFNISTFSDAPGSFLGDHEFVILGLGVKSWLIGYQLLEPPTVEVHNVTQFYSRPIALFAVPNTPARGNKARFLGTFAPDGTTFRGQLTNYYQAAQAEKDPKIH